MAITDVLRKKADAMDKKDIICPFCFKKFHDNEVVFRSSYVYKENKSMGGKKGMNLFDNRSAGKGSVTLNWEDEDEKLFIPYDGAYDRTYSHRDKELESFWESRGKGSGFQTFDPAWFYPHIDPKDPNFDRMIKKEGPNVDDKGLVRDKDGFVVRVNEKFGDNSVIMTKLCPHCHNPLPFTDYGKYPIRFISIVGIRGSGKTVYLNQLMSKFSSAISHVDYTMGPNTLAQATGQEKVAKGYPLPASTDDMVMRRPVAVDMRRKENGVDKSVTIVFYDIAGENCVDPEENRLDANNNTVSQFLAFSDGLLFLIDPEQVPIFSNLQDAKEIPEVQRVIDTVNKIRPAFNHDTPHWDSIPVAVVLTKSDTLDKDNNDIDEIIFRQVDYTTCKVKGFARDEFVKINNALRNEFDRNADQIEASLKAFYRRGYFAVSAITCGVENKFEKYQNWYTLDEENYKKFVFAKKWAEGWAKRSPAERKQYYQCPIKDTYDNEINLPLDTELTGEVLDIDTELTAITKFDTGETKEITLTLKDIVEDIDLLGFPVANPDPRRVEEPFLWLLWQLEQVPPYFRMAEPAPEIPQRKFFESIKHYETVSLKHYEEELQEWLIRQNEDKQKHYCRERR